MSLTYTIIKEVKVCYDKQESSERHSFCVSFQSSLLLPETGVDFRFNLSGGDFFLFSFFVKRHETVRL